MNTLKFRFNVKVILIHEESKGRNSVLGNLMTLISDNYAWNDEGNSKYQNLALLPLSYIYIIFI